VSLSLAKYSHVAHALPNFRSTFSFQQILTFIPL
jgi:hypothetical protein